MATVRILKNPDQAWLSIMFTGSRIREATATLKATLPNGCWRYGGAPLHAWSVDRLWLPALTKALKADRHRILDER